MTSSRPEIRLIAVDLDGTLLDDKHRITPANRQAIEAAQQAGIVFAICTGRFFEDASLHAKDYGLNCPVISVNGGKVALAPFGQVLRYKRQEHDVAMTCFNALEELDAAYFVFGQQRVGIRKDGDKHLSQINFGEARMLAETGTTYHYGKEACLETVQGGMYKYYVHSFGDRQHLDRIIRALEQIPNISLAQSSTDNVEIMPPHVNKGRGMQDLADYLHIPLANTMAIGDQENDLPMIRLAGLGVAMGNATREVKSSAHLITESNTQDGVAHAIQRYALGVSEGQP